MTTTSVKNISIIGIVSVLPEIELANIDQTCVTDIEKVIASTGIHSRRVVGPQQTALDLGNFACQQLLAELAWDINDVALIVFVTQTPDYPLPGNAVLLQNKLNLPKTTLAFDVNLGCSGFIYGFWLVSQLLNGLKGSKALLVVGDTTSQQYSDSNRSVSSLFGDAVSAIAIEKTPSTDEITFNFGSDGSGAPYLIQPNNGARNPGISPELFMDGTQVFVFTLREIPKSIMQCVEQKGWRLADIDYCIMHQANEMMLKRLAKKLGLNTDQVIISMKNIGNTSSASIPLALCLSLSEQLTTRSCKLILSGFGVGWSWGSAAMTSSPLRVCQLIDLASDNNLYFPFKQLKTL
ncbi:3-oxoacyl-(acyl-carrier protein) synthase [Shewanella denitrificans OS217]|uniref:3-oxoacyl-(Acyl-carrier protein) synthase n=1 Tax=Shewanella denitrificans (strain OS217 / ATCC BAA-1090 / DSM 15013) TaxID=318161 RepID=Q12JH9_SHEDO|nr:ketoacyl-ACP synthase III [Shewanella denitrificans]ABE56397.1 3-oxoacyl-(acyl-carrier protein) synthase [Shewanella denitrificans OS217]